MSEHSVEVVRKFTEAALAGDAETAFSLLSPDCVFVEAASLPYGGSHRGPGAIAEMLGQLFQTFELKPEPTEFADGGTFVVATSLVEITARATGRNIRMPIAEIYDVADGLIQRNRVFYHDTKALLDLLP